MDFAAQAEAIERAFAPLLPVVSAEAGMMEAFVDGMEGVKLLPGSALDGTLYAAAANIRQDAANAPQAAQPAAQQPAQAAAQAAPPQANAPRGIRNNNPGNLRPLTRDQWQGQTGTEENFSVFDTPENGLRGMAVLLTTYHQTHGLRTVNGIIGRYASPGENDTQAYINHVSRTLGVTPDQEIDLRDRAVFSTLMNTMIRHENGQNPYSAQQISDAINSAWEHRDRRR